MEIIEKIHKILKLDSNKIININIAYNISDMYKLLKIIWNLTDDKKILESKLNHLILEGTNWEYISQKMDSIEKL